MGRIISFPIQNDTSQLSSDMKDYLVCWLLTISKERGEATNSSHINKENKDEDHDVACCEELDGSDDDDDDCRVSVLLKPGEASSPDIKNCVHIEMIPQSPYHTWIIFQTNFTVYFRFAWFILLGFLLRLQLDFVLILVILNRLWYQYFVYYLRVKGKKMLPINLSTTSLTHLLVIVYVLKSSNVSFSAVYWWHPFMFHFFYLQQFCTRKQTR